MKDIVVLARTQRIVVNPMARTVSVVNSGPVGPAGPTGSSGAITEEQAVDAVATSIVGDDHIVANYDDPGGDINFTFNPNAVDHDWKEDGWAPFDTFLVSDSAPLGNSSSQTLSVTAGGRGRITNSNTQGNLRIAYARDDTEWMDSEICTLHYGSDVFSTSGTNPSSAQGGQFHRAYVDGDGVWRAVVVTNNIFLSDTNVVNGNVWNSEADALALGSNGGQKTYTDDYLRRHARVYAVDRFIFSGSINECYVNPANRNGIEVGTLCTFDAALDNTFDIATAQVVLGVGPGLITFTDVEGGAAVAYKPESGIIIPTTVSARRFWPYWVKSRLIGSKLYTKVWKEKDPEPDWANTEACSVYDFAGANTPSPTALFPDEPGKCGLIGAHVRNTRYLEYGQFSCKKL